MYNTPVPRITPSNVSELECPKRFAMRLYRRWPKAERTSGPSANLGLCLHKVLAQTFSPTNLIDGRPLLGKLEQWARSEFYRIRYSDTQFRRPTLSVR